MPRDGPEAVPEGKGPSPRVEPGKTVDITAVMEMLQKMNSHFDKMDCHFEKSEQRAKMSEERLDGLQQQLSRLALEKDEQGEKTGERKEGAVVNGGHGDTPFNKGSESPSASAREEQMFSNNEEQGHLALFKSGASSRRQIADSRKGDISSGELHTSEMQSVAARTGFRWSRSPNPILL